MAVTETGNCERISMSDVTKYKKPVTETVDPVPECDDEGLNAIVEKLEMGLGADVD